MPSEGKRGGFSLRKTKLVATLGPATDRPGVLLELIKQGLDVARLNFSHGSHAEHLKRMEEVRAYSEQVGRFVGVLADISGPKIRLGTLAQPLHLKTNDIVRLIEASSSDEEYVLPVQVPDVLSQMREGIRFSIADGLITMVATKVTASSVTARVLVGGIVSSRKGISFPGLKIKLRTITEKDKDDIIFATKQGADFLAISFVRSEHDVVEARQIAREAAQGRDVPRIIAKIETPFALERIEEIAKEADGVMVARGDLGVEIYAEEVPLEQKRLIHICNSLGKPVITATQMLESMVHSPIPTRAEATDVATAILDGTDAVMLSGETAVGEYPIEALTVLGRIAERTERELHNSDLTQVVRPSPVRRSVADSIAYCAAELTGSLPIKAIVASTKSGHSARVIAKFRPDVTIVGATPYISVARSLTLSFGVTPAIVSKSLDTDKVLDESVRAAQSMGIIKEGDLVVLVLGLPFGVGGTTNLLKVHLVGGGYLMGERIG